MSRRAAAIQAQAQPSVLAPWLELLRPRVASMVTLMALLGAATAPGSTFPRALEAALLITLVTGCASVLNQVLERETDALMPRTAARPLVTGRIGVVGALVFATLLGAAGAAGLALRFNLLSAFLSLATLLVYVALYTPLKRVSTSNTVVGAVPGAAPPLLGYAALAGDVGPWAWCMFAVIFAWQFPHFFAIAWLYREDYRRAGHRMLPCVEDAEGLAGRHSVLYALALIPVALLPLTAGLAGPFYGIGAGLLSVAYLVASVAFARREDRARARAVVVTSLFYLPLWAGLILTDSLVSASLR